MDIWSNSDSQYDFLSYILWLLESYLVPGDYFIVDNATIHCAMDTFSFISDVLQATGVHSHDILAYLFT